MINRQEQLEKVLRNLFLIESEGDKELVEDLVRQQKKCITAINNNDLISFNLENKRLCEMMEGSSLKKNSKIESSGDIVY